MGKGEKRKMCTRMFCVLLIPGWNVTSECIHGTLQYSVPKVCMSPNDRTPSCHAEALSSRCSRFLSKLQPTSTRHGGYFKCSFGRETNTNHTPLNAQVQIKRSKGVKKGEKRGTFLTALQSNCGPGKRFVAILLRADLLILVTTLGVQGVFFQQFISKMNAARSEMQIFWCFAAINAGLVIQNGEKCRFP